MKYLFLTLATALILVGCSERNQKHPGIQINDSLMHISANPITGKPVTFWHELSEPRMKLLQEALAWRYGPSGITIMQKDGSQPVVLSEVEVSNSKLTRKISVKQGDTVLYAREQDVTKDNLESLGSCTIVSSEWEDVSLSTEDIAFSVDYWRSYETKYGGGGESIVSDMVMIPVRKE
jgi:hypothetical protein